MTIWNFGNAAVADETNRTGSNARALQGVTYPDRLPVLDLLSSDSVANLPNWVQQHEDQLRNVQHHEVVVLDGGHYLHWTQSKAMAEKITAFLGENLGDRRRMTARPRRHHERQSRDSIPKTCSGPRHHEPRSRVRPARPVQHRGGGTRRGVAPVRHPASRRRPARPRHPSGSQDHRRRGAAHARVQRLDPRFDAPRRPGGGDHRPGEERRRHRDHRALARPAAGEPLRRRPARDAEAHPDRRHVHLQAPVPRRRLLLVSPARARRLRAGDGPVRHHRRRTLRCVVLAPGRPVRHPHPGRSARGRRTRRAVPAFRGDPHRDGPVRQRHADQR